MAIEASSKGFPLCATSHNSSRSVLPGRGKGIAEEIDHGNGEEPQGSQVREPVRQDRLVHPRRWMMRRV